MSANPDRLGDAIRELARTMAEHGADHMTFELVNGPKRALYEVRCVRTSWSSVPAHRITNHDSRITEVQAFGPASSEARQMADNSKE